jgi:hypothetical protein
MPENSKNFLSYYVFLVRRRTSLDAAKWQNLTVDIGWLEVCCVPSATIGPFIHWNQNEAVCNTVFVIEVK